MDDCQKWPDTELPGLPVHPNNHDMPYTYQATNDQLREHPCYEPCQCSVAQLVWVDVCQIVGEHNLVTET